MSDDDRFQLLSRLLDHERFRYSPSQAALLRFLIQSAEDNRSVLATEIAHRVFGDTDNGERGSSRAREAIHRLRHALNRYFAEDSRAAAATHAQVKIDYSPRQGYKLSLHERNNPPISGARVDAQPLTPVKNPELRVFLCHSSGDKERVRRLYKSLFQDEFSPWLDEEDLLPGQDWDMEIRKAVRSSQVVLVCLSAASATKEGFVQKEIKLALDVADEKPDGVIYLIPVRLEDCPVPERLKKWHRVDLFQETGYSRLVLSLRLKSEQA